MRYLSLLFVVFCFVGCASSSADWKSQTSALSPEQPMECLLVIGVDPDGTQGRRFESAFKQSFNGTRIETLTSASIGEFPNLEQLEAYIEKHGVHYVLVTQLVDVKTYEEPVTGTTTFDVHFLKNNEANLNALNDQHKDASSETDPVSYTHLTLPTIPLV